jgi:NAD(P)-dependent dehydrogenase (short-subunit alcohol dehydrogenase family)
LLHYYLTDINVPSRLPETLSKIINADGKITHLIFCQRYRGDHDDWQGELDTSLTVTKNIIDLAVDRFDDNRERSIVVVGSVVGSLVAYEQPLGYHVAKAGLRQMVRYYAVLLGKKGIRINSVSPAAVLKPEAAEFYRKNKKLHDMFKKMIPLGRMGTPDDIYNTVKYLCSSAASYVTGQDITVDGGLSLLAQEGLMRKIIDEA